VSGQPRFEARSLSAPEYVLALHEPTHNVPVLLRNRARGQTLQRIASVETIASPEFQRWLTEQNRAGSDIFIGMNPLKEGASNRTKDNIKEVRHLYLDLDDDARAALANIRDSLDAPPPNFVLDTSPGKYQVVWKIEGLDVEQAESLLRSLAGQFGGDSAATDATRVLRMPGFINRKYPNEPEFPVQAHHESNRVHQLRDFTIREDSPDAGRHIHIEDAHGSYRTMLRGHRSQSEADWAFAKRALARGDDPEEVIRRIADYRATDKHDPVYYARLTVQKARIELDQQHTFSQPDSAQSNSLKAPEHTP
jgi:RepB DNA-primase from phage plasmid